MNLHQAHEVMVRTHLAALRDGVRASSEELRSGPGIGKSSIVVQACTTLARALNEPVGMVDEFLATKESPDVLGFGLPTKQMTMVFTQAPWYPKKNNMKVFMPDGTVVPKHAWEGDIPRVGIVFLDEFGQAGDEVKKAAAELLLHGEVGDTILPEGWRVLAASNRMSDRSGVLRSLMFLVNRRLEINIDAHLPTWNDWVASLRPELRPHHLTISFANRSPDLVFRDAVPAGDEPFCTPRTLVLMDRDLRALRSDDDIAHDRLPMDGIAREVCKGWIGGGESAQFFTHIKFADQLPDLADIERDPKTAKLPPARDGQMVAAFFAAHNLMEHNAEKVLAYITRMHIEMQVLAIKTITPQQECAKFLTDTRAFGAWLREHKDLLMASKV